MIILSVAMRLPICRNTAEPTHINQSEGRCSPGAYTLEIERARARERERERANGGAGSGRSAQQEEEGGELGRVEEGLTSVGAADALVYLGDVLVRGFHLLTLGLEGHVAFHPDFLGRCHELDGPV